MPLPVFAKPAKFATKSDDSEVQRYIIIQQSTSREEVLDIGNPQRNMYNVSNTKSSSAELPPAKTCRGPANLRSPKVLAVLKYF